MPISDPHNTCLKCLGEACQTEKCKLCGAFHPRTKKEQDFRLKQLLIKSTLHSQPAANRQDPALGASVCDTVLRKDSSTRDPWHWCSLAPQPEAIGRHRLTSPVPHKQHRKTERGRSPAPKPQDRQGIHRRTPESHPPSQTSLRRPDRNDGFTAPSSERQASGTDTSGTI